MTIRINDTAPDFTADTTEGQISFHDWIGDGWAILFSHPKDFTPVCTTELGYVASVADQFAKRNCKLIGISVDPVEQHNIWKEDITTATGQTVSYPMIGDPELKISKLYDMLGAEAGDSFEGRTAVDNQTVRSVFLVGPDKKVKMQMSYPMTTGRNFEELIRVLDSVQLTYMHKVATPAGWTEGDDVIVVPAVSDDDARAQHGSFDAKLPYLRMVKQPEQ